MQLARQNSCKQALPSSTHGAQQQHEAAPQQQHRLPDESFWRLLLEALQQAAQCVLCKLLCCSKAMAKLVHSTCAGVLHSGPWVLGLTRDTYMLCMVWLVLLCSSRSRHVGGVAGHCSGEQNVWLMHLSWFGHAQQWHTWLSCNWRVVLPVLRVRVQVVWTST
jgi:hypothetical protein